MIKYNYETKRIEGTIKRGKREIPITIDFSFDKLEKKPTIKQLEFLQVMLYVMVGGGMLGNFAMRQPADFYIDLRVGRLPYSKSDIFRAIETLKAMADFLKLDASHLPELDFYGAWVF